VRMCVRACARRQRRQVGGFGFANAPFANIKGEEGALRFMLIEMCN